MRCLMKNARVMESVLQEIKKALHVILENYKQLKEKLFTISLAKKKKKKMGVQAAEGKSATYHLAQNEARITSYCLPFVIIPMPNIE